MRGGEPAVPLHVGSLPPLGLCPILARVEGLLCRDLVGRDRELALLGHALDDAAAGHGTSVVVLGEPGIGKSRLARAAADAASARGCAVLVGRAVPSRVAVAFRPLSEALLAFLRRLAQSRQGAVVDPLPPALARLTAASGGSPGLDPSSSLVAVGEALLGVLASIAGRHAALLVLEDLHWADAETLAVVEYLADNVDRERILLVATARLGEAGAGLPLARRLAARRVVTMLELRRLDDAHVDAMVRDCLQASDVPPPVESLMRARSDGVPLLVEELLAGLVDAGALVRHGAGWRIVSDLPSGVPLTFADSVHQRLGGLDDGDRRVLHSAAVLGRRFEWSLVAPVSGLGEERVLAALRRAVAAQLVEADDDGFRFRHALTRDAILADLLPPERVALARAAAAQIEKAHPDLAGGWCERAADLFEQAGDRRHAAELLVRVGQQALRDGALTTAENVLERARSLSDDTSCWLAASEMLTETLSLAGKTERVFEVGGALVGRLSVLAPMPERTARVHLRLAHAAGAAGNRALATTQMLSARLEAEEVGDEGLDASIDAMAAWIAFEERRAGEAVVLAQSALEAARRTGRAEVACEALELLGRIARQHDPVAARAAFREADDIASQHDLPMWQLRARHELATLDLISTGDVEAFHQVRDLAVANGAWALAATVDVQIAAGLVVQVRTEEADTAAERAVTATRRFGHAGLPKALVLHAAVHAVRGDERGMEVLLHEALGLAPEDDELAAYAMVQCRGMLGLVTENRSSARSFVRDGFRLLRRSGSSATLPLHGLWGLLVAVDGSDPDEAAEASLCVGGPSPLGPAFAGYAEAVRLGRAGRQDAARAQLERADGSFGVGLAWYRHWCRRLVAEAALTDQWGEPATWLRESAVYFERAGHQRIASACRRLLKDAGVPVPRKGRGSAPVPDRMRARGVTSREMDVLQLVAAGLGNRDIATRLYLSPRTVENHVAHLLAKTGASSRAELSHMAEEV